MKKLFLILIILSIPTSVFAGTREIDMWTDFNALVQPDPVLEYSQNNMSARYHADQTKLTDTITYSMWKKSWTTKWPWSAASAKMRKKVRECRQANKLSSVAACGWYDYKITRISPSGNYIELSGDGWDSGMWRMIDTRTGNIVLSNDNGVEKSMWTRDRKQFIWQTYNCEIGWCSDPRWIFITEIGKFPKHKKVDAR